MSADFHDVVPQSLYQEMLAAKYIKEQTHPHHPELVIANYTDACMWDQVWNDATMRCRGIIRNAETNKILARPYSKFFNYEQEQAPVWNLDTRLHVTEKVDGSLGILYPTLTGDYAIATRGSFMSEQAAWATQHLHQTYPRFQPDPEITYLFEIIYPENRVVVNYGDFRGLVLLGGVVTRTGDSIDAEALLPQWPGFAVHIHHYEAPLQEILKLPPRTNAEGFVLWNRQTDERVKIKYEDYKTLHRYLTNTTAKHVWEVLSTNQDPDEVFASAPDEFHEWLRGVVKDFREQFDAMYNAALHDYDQIQSTLPLDAPRKDFALAAQSSPHRPLLFRLYDGASTDDLIWKLLKPKGTGSTVRNVSSDAD